MLSKIKNINSIVKIICMILLMISVILGSFTYLLIINILMLIIMLFCKPKLTFINLLAFISLFIKKYILSKILIIISILIIFYLSLSITEKLIFKKVDKENMSKKQFLLYKMRFYNSDLPKKNYLNTSFDLRDIIMLLVNILLVIGSIYAF